MSKNTFAFLILLIFQVVFNNAFCNATDLAVLPGDSILKKKSSLQLNREYLSSTHSTRFKGFSFQLNYEVAKNTIIGLGYERTVCAYHPDNNWNLFQLKLAPLFLSEQFKIYQINSFNLFSEFREGISFIRYNKEEFKTNPGVIFPVKENGFYGYAGLGAGWEFLKNFNLQTAVGFKGYHFSTNSLEVNPHGVNFQLGLQYKFSQSPK